ncbi:ABC transporter substrate-binding protein [Microlunatus speluncae]|uniref:ABC transporter substrate-binding protein n=1 Tax=Microlunatus speluncae TaxID=2594267 RepID=UPI0012667C96|nr:extracellular solute-binding protein [Microlunatus speluncae]
MTITRPPHDHDHPARERRADRTLSRRQALALGGAAALAVGAAGCEVQTTSDPPTGGGSETEIEFPAPKAELPTDAVTFRTMVADGSNVLPPIFAAFSKKFPNITVDCPQTTWDTIAEAVTLGVRNGTAPDMFSKPLKVPMQIAVANGWCAPLEEVVPDFAQWKAAYPETAFIPGHHVFDGKTYGWTTTSNYSQYGFYVFYEKSLLEKAEHDPAAEPFSWQTLRSVAKKITSPDDDVYGLMISSKRLGQVALGLAERAGLAGGELNLRTGEYQQTHPLLKGAIELLLAIKDDGSIIPGYLNLSQDLEISRHSEGKTGLELQGSWCISKWKKDNPDFNYSVAMPPTGDDKVFHHASFAEGTAAPYIIYAKSPHRTIAGELLSYLGSVDGQAAMTVLSEGALVSEMPAANEKANTLTEFPPAVTSYRKLFGELLVQQPLPAFVNPEVGRVTMEIKPVVPALDDIVEGIFTGQVTDIDRALQELQDKSNQGLDAAIATAVKKGAKVSREDYTFRNWDPEQDYTSADYDER